MKKQIGKVLLWVWALLFIVCLYAVFFVSWVWTFAIVLYVGASVLVLNFMAPQRPSGDESPREEDRV